MQSKRTLLAEKIDQVRKTKHELEIVKIVNFFLGCSGSYSSNLLTFEIKTS